MDTPLFHLFPFFSFFIKKFPDVIKFFLCFKNTFDIHFIPPGHFFFRKRSVYDVL
ncbi:hypothetical protein A1SG_00054 [Escherichia coli KTE54]|nr:hypothetical protein A1SG_00054 [Escherichia coli KTE54]